jgi:hypothetical protein
VRLIPAADVDAKRRIAVWQLPDTCDIVRPTFVADAGGGQTTTLTTVAAGVACRYTEDLGARDQAYVARFGNAVSARLVLPAETDVRETDRITTVTVDGTLLTRLVNGAPVAVSFAVRAVPRESQQASQTVYIGRV